MYTLNLTPQVAEAISLTSEEMATLTSVRDRANKYLEENPNANCNPSVKAYIDKYASNQAQQIKDNENFRKSLI